MTDTPSFNVSVFSPQSFEVADVRLIGAASLVRTRPYGRGASGFRNTIRLAEGMFASWAVVKRGEAVEERYDSSGAMKINLRLEGPSTIAGTGQDQGPYPITPPMCSALLQPLGEGKVELFAAGTREKSVTISCTRDHLSGELGFLPERFSGPVAAFLSGSSYSFAFLRADMTLEMKLAAEAFFDPIADPFALRLHLLSRAHDILRLFFEQTALQDSTGARFRPGEIELVERTKTRVVARLDQIPPTAHLATELGTSSSRLMRLFKAVDGRTIGEFVTAMRMARALELMQERRLSITQIAFEVGYEHSANFSTAFRRHYGITPRQAMHGIGHEGG